MNVIVHVEKMLKQSKASTKLLVQCSSALLGPFDVKEKGKVERSTWGTWPKSDLSACGFSPS